MKDLKFLLSHDMFTAFAELNQFFNVYKNYIENLTGKSKDQHIEDFITNQMNVLDSLTSCRINKVKETMINSAKEWEKKNQEDKEN